MPLTLITGPANSAKAGRVLDAYRAGLDRDPLLVVPRFEDVAHYQRELAREGAVFGGRVLRFAWLWAEIARRCGYREARLGPLQRERVVRAAIAGAGLSALADSATSAGFARAAGVLIDELQAALVEPDELAAWLDEWAGGAGERRAYARDVAAIHTGYRDALQQIGRVDDDGFARGALASLREAPERWGGAPMFLYGFDDLTALELAAVEALAGAPGVEVTVSLTWEDGREAFAGRSRTVERLRALADREELLPARAEHYAVASRAALHHLERCLFRPHGRREDPGDAVRLLEAGGDRAEIELIAAEVLDMLRAGIPHEEIAVVFRSPRNYASLVEQVFRAYGIPVALDRSLTLGHTALGRALLGLLRCALGAGSAEDLLAYLRAPGKFEHAYVLDRFEAHARRRGARTAAAARAVWEEDHPALDELDALRKAGVRGMAALCDAVVSRAELLFSAPHRGNAPRLDADEAADGAAYAAVSAALSELAAMPELSGLAAPGSDDLLEALEQVEIMRGGARATGAVLVADPLAVRARRFQAVVIGGLQEGEFPRPPRAEPFLPDDLRRRLAAAGVALRDDAARVDDEAFLFYAVASRPEQRLVLSFRTSDEEGRPLVASSFVDEVRALFSDALQDARRRRPLGEVTWPAAQAPTATELERSLRAALPPERPRPIEPVRLPAALDELAATGPVSPGALEAYAQCPVKWLVQRVLRARGIDPDAEPLVRGSFAHAMLERTLRGLRARKGSARITTEALPLALALLDEAVEEACAGDEFVLAPTAAQSRAVAHRVRAQVRRLLRHEATGPGPFEPEHLELGFGFEGEAGADERAGAEPSLPALELGDGALRVRGRIDRVDVDPGSGRAVVRDYKAGKGATRHDEKNWRETGQLQVALYMLAVRRGLERELAGGVYQSLRGSSLRARGLLLDVPEVRELTATTLRKADLREPEEFEAALRGAEEAALELARGMRAGELAPCPDTCGYNGGGCEYPGICRSAGT